MEPGQVRSGGSIRDIKIDAPRYDQKLTVTVSSDAEVTIAVYLERDKAEVEGKLDKDQKPASALAFQQDVLKSTLEAVIPAKQEAIVRVISNKKAATVKVSLKGR